MSQPEEVSLEQLTELEEALDQVLTVNEEIVRELEGIGSRFPVSSFGNEV